MRWGIYARDDNLEATAFARGLFAVGENAVWRSAGDYSQGQIETFDAIVLTGLRAKGAIIAKDYSHLPCIIIDYGYLRRVSGKSTWGTGHWQISLGGLNKPPNFECPSDRFEALKLAVAHKPQKGIDLVLGQHSGDPSHGLLDEEMRQWAKNVCEKHNAVFCPHPDSPGLAPKGVEIGSFKHLLPQSGRVHTLCSNGGLEAIINGCAAVAYMPERCHWSGLSGDAWLGHETVVRCLHKLAYGQWKLDEMREGLPQRFILENMHRWNARSNMSLTL